ncbi:uncharacterized protein PgNI_04226, partial [Pyricularia grisea]|uniref:Uncharacterized protein n=1 Tax=Pyricularia grisea TaxID=148305 RepID=A0A6P8B8C1_PYRGI
DGVVVPNHGRDHSGGDAADDGRDEQRKQLEASVNGLVAKDCLEVNGYFAERGMKAEEKDTEKANASTVSRFLKSLGGSIPSSPMRTSTQTKIAHSTAVATKSPMIWGLFQANSV